MAVERAEIDGSDHKASPDNRTSAKGSRPRSHADRWVEPQGSPTGLAHVPDLNDLMRLSRRPCAQLQHAWPAQRLWRPLDSDSRRPTKSLSHPCRRVSVAYAYQ